MRESSGVNRFVGVSVGNEFMMMCFCKHVIVKCFK